MKKKERRNMSTAPTLRSAQEGQESRLIEGYALVFDTESQDLGGFRERIAPGALDGVIERSDVLSLYNHSFERGVLARCTRGEGSLELIVDDLGLHYSFDAPRTALGDEVLEGVRRGDIRGSSFAFTVAEDSWEKEADGRYLRTIKRFGELFDVSPVIHPAYEATSVDARGLETLKRSEIEAEDPGEDEAPEEEAPAEQPAEEQPAEEESPEEAPEESGNNDGEEQGQRSVSMPQTETRNNNVTINNVMKKKKFSLLRAIRSIAERQPMDAAELRIAELGREAAERAGVEYSGQIQIPFESRDDSLMTEDTPANGIVAGEEEAGGNAIPTETLDLLGPLTERMVLTQMGARMLSLTGNVEVPTYSGADVAWEGEISPAKKTAGKFGKIKLSPKRLSAEMFISKQFLLQTSPTAEALIRQDLINRIGLKLQSTILGKEKGTDTMPQGMLYGVTPDSADITYDDIIDMEAAIEGKNVFGDLKYALSPKAKAILRKTKVDAGSGLFVMESSEVLGVQALSTGGMADKGLILGEWSNLWIGNFGAIDLIVDPYTAANTAQIRLVINAWFDYAEVRDAFVKKILK